MSTTSRSEQARVAALSRCVRTGERPADDPALADAKRNFKALRAEEYITRVLSEGPPLTDQQRTRLADLFRAGGAA